MSLFDKCNSFKTADEVKEKGLYPYFKTLEQNEGPIVTLEGREFVMAGSNNYLGLTSHPEVIEAAQLATKKYGTGCSGSRYLTGTLDLHIELEEKLAEYLNYESVLLFSTGYQTALGVISSLVQRGDYIISDKENHACIINGALASKGALGNFVRYKHNDINDLERVLKLIPEKAGKLIASDGVFSVSGELAKVDELSKIAKKYNAKLLIDDAHAFGVVGNGGRGTPNYFNSEKGVDLLMGTFSKTLASLGGYIAGPSKVINYIKHHSPALIFSASPTPASCAAALKSLEILKRQPELVQQLSDNSRYMTENLSKLGFNIENNISAIVPVIVGEQELALQMWRKLFDKGIFVNAFVPPGVPPNMSMMRTSYMASHKKEHLDRILDKFSEVGKEMNLI
ncbi:aminotransferase class I/II-fold pyridoxal phosphate-dependent enzyme [Candidatus Kapabacteria bacterium]|nr:aminotransferase class I/II-fold pyridoxal phosphate-dependent enzyme [Candidatus Kapabacteria bacterium]